MAFRQSTFALPRQSTLPETQKTPSVVPEEQEQAFDGSQEWVLFPPHAARSLSQTEISFAAWPSRSTGLSRLSDFGSFDTTARSGLHGEDVSDAADNAAVEDEDLDSLDEGLHAFQEPSMYQVLHNLDQSRSILPAHDGLGTFPASSLPVQGQLSWFEQYNPRKRPIEQPDWPSVQRYLDMADNNDGTRIEMETRERIEKWRLEQSKILLDEIERKTRKGSFQNDSSRSGISHLERERIINGMGDTVNRDKQSKGVASGAGSAQTADKVSLLERITQRIIRDFFGIDDALLGVILGESLQSNSYPPPASPSFTSSLRISNKSVASLPDVDWNTRCLDRLTREIGVLAQHLSNHPGAFSTPPDPIKWDHAGIPNYPNPPKAHSESSTPLDRSGTAPSTSPYFKPTLQDHHTRYNTATSDTTHAALWGIEEEESSSAAVAQDHEYWERTPNVRTIFRLLQHRFATPTQPPTSNPSIATTATPASLRRAAVIRQHHPLGSRPTARRNRASSVLHSSHHNSNQFHSFKRPDSSCASLSVRKGIRGGSGSSRNYWDLGGSAAGSASAVAVASGGLGAWGEV